MRTSKKILSVVLALMMLLSVVALGAYAMPADTVAEMTIKADKDSYAAGDEITLTVYCQTNDEIGGVEMLGQYFFNYDSAGIASLGNEDTADAQAITVCGFTPAASQVSAYNEANSKVWNNTVCEGLGETPDAGDKLFALMVIQTADAYVDAKAAPVELFSFKMKVADTAADGDYTINLNASSVTNYNMFVTDDTVGGLYGDAPGDFGLSASNMWSLGSVTIHVGAAGPIVTYEKTQLKLNAGGYDVQMRITSKITDSDFDTYFPNTTTHGTDPAPTANALTSVGIVAFDGAQADFDEATAKALVINGTAADGYKTAETDYISKASDTADGYFGAILRGSRAAFENKPVTFLGFAKYLDADGNAQVIFYEAAVEKTVTTSYFGS